MPARIPSVGACVLAAVLAGACGGGDSVTGPSSSPFLKLASMQPASGTVAMNAINYPGCTYCTTAVSAQFTAMLDTDAASAYVYVEGYSGGRRCVRGSTAWGSSTTYMPGRQSVSFNLRYLTPECTAPFSIDRFEARLYGGPTTLLHEWTAKLTFNR